MQRVHRQPYNSRMQIRSAILLSLGLLCSSCRTASAPPPVAPVAAPVAAAAAAPATLQIPFEYTTLENGLQVVVAPDHTIPLATVAMYYGVGFRLEPQNRTGFAHLFEHLMFDGSRNLPKGAMDNLVQGNGGSAGGSTRLDFTDYDSTVQSNAVEMVVWAEADRMKGLQLNEAILATEKDIVKNEVRLNVLNTPYGGFPWIDLPMAANVNWHNAHNFYGDLTHIEAATLADVESFFRTWYSPNNAVLAVTGDVDPAQVIAWARKHFGSIPRQPEPPALDIREPRQSEERRGTRVAPMAERPALGMAWHAPDPSSPDYVTMVVIDQILGGADGWLHESVVQRRGLSGEINSFLNPFGSPFLLQGPTLYGVALFHDAATAPDTIVASIEEPIARLRENPVDAATLARAKVKARADFYAQIEANYGAGRGQFLGTSALFWNDPGRVNRIEGEIAAVTPEMILAVAREAFRPTNRTVFAVQAGGAK